jgi:hypothetical protein
MPTPQKGETEDEYVKRCIPIVLHEDGDVEHIDHAIAKCHGMYRQWKKKNRKADQV